MSTWPSGPGKASFLIHPGEGLYLPLQKLLCHRLHEGLLFQWGNDSSSSPNPLLSNTTSTHSAPNLSLCLKFCVALIPTFSHPSPASASS